MVIKEEIFGGVTSADVAATRQLREDMKAKDTAPATTPPVVQPASNEPVVVQAVSGRPGKDTAVLVYNPARPDAPWSIGAASDYGPSVQKQASTMVQKTIDQQPQDSQARIQQANTQDIPTFTYDESRRVRIDDLPQGGDFSATRQRLLALPDGTPVQIGDSSNQDVFSYKGGLVNSRGEYYTGYGGLTNAGAAAEREQLPGMVPAGSGRIVEDQHAQLPVKAAGSPDELVLGGRKYSDPLNAMYWYGLGNTIMGKYDDAAAWVQGQLDKYDVPSATRQNIEFGIGFDWALAGMVAGLPIAAGATIGLAEAGAQDVLSGRIRRGRAGDPYNGLPEVWASGIENTLPTVPQTIVMGASPSSFKETPNYVQGAGELAGFASLTAIGTIGLVKGSGGALRASRAYEIAGGNMKATNIVRPGSGIKAVADNVLSEYGKELPENYLPGKPARQFDPVEQTPGTSRGRARAAAYDSGEKIGNVFEMPDNAKVYADLVNEQAGGEAIPIDPWGMVGDKGKASIDAGNVKIEPADMPVRKTIDVNKKIVYTPSDQPVLKPFKDTDMDWMGAQKGIGISIGKSDRVFRLRDRNGMNGREVMPGIYDYSGPQTDIGVGGKLIGSYLRNDPLSDILAVQKQSTRRRPQLLEQVRREPLTKTSSIDTLIAGKTRTTSRAMSKNISLKALSLGIPAITATGMYATSKAKQGATISPWPGEKYSIPGQTSKTLHENMLGQKKGTTGTGGSGSSYTGSGGSMASFTGLGLAGVSMASMGVGRMRGIGGDYPGYPRARKHGRSQEKYFTGDITTILYGKTKRKAKRRSH